MAGQQVQHRKHSSHDASVVAKPAVRKDCEGGFWAGRAHTRGGSGCAMMTDQSDIDETRGLGQQDKFIGAIILTYAESCYALVPK